MNRWEDVVAKMAFLPREFFLGRWPVFANDISPPAGLLWPAELPASDALRRFYALCDGGAFGNCAYNIWGLAELPTRTERWIEELRDYDARGDILSPGGHLVFGEDSAGAPLIWDAATDRVATFFWKGGDWEPIAPSAEAFLNDLFNPDPAENPEWAESIEMILRA
jgi:hypothetical protein